ncbi:MAG: IscS subfamily cysteine desulfurase [Rhodothermia bacterium]|nr:MAG: IscS subfamily cysteine desulfurase [Rhodothermia bacterium]
MSDIIYLDYNATTPVDPDVLDRMIPYFLKEYGNPSNKSHRYGWAADEAATIAREQLAELIHASPTEITFTGGATEAINMAIKGIAKSRSSKGKHIITCATEHSAVLESCKSLQFDGFEITALPVDANGLLSAGNVADALREDTILVAIMWANNETGVIHPIADIAAVVAEHQALFLTDATQAVGKIPVSVEGVDLLACSAHKFYGPKGVGALFIRESRPSIRITPLIHGGSQEGGKRAGTLNVPGIVGLGAAAEIAKNHLSSDHKKHTALRNRFEDALRDAIPGLKVNGADVDRLPQTSDITFPGIRAGEMISDIGRLAVSTGSACGTEKGKLSHVLAAHGVSEEAAKGTIRFSLGRNTTEVEIDEAVRLLVDYVQEHARQPAMQD